MSGSVAENWLRGMTTAPAERAASRTSVSTCEPNAMIGTRAASGIVEMRSAIETRDVPRSSKTQPMSPACNREVAEARSLASTTRKPKACAVPVTLLVKNKSPQISRPILGVVVISAFRTATNNAKRQRGRKKLVCESDPRSHFGLLLFAAFRTLEAKFNTSQCESN